MSDDEGRGSGEPIQLCPVLKSDVNKFEKNLEDEPGTVPRKWHWNWPEGKLVYGTDLKRLKFIKDRPRYGYGEEQIIYVISFVYLWCCIVVYYLNVGFRACRNKRSYYFICFAGQSYPSIYWTSLTWFWGQFPGRQ